MVWNLFLCFHILGIIISSDFHILFVFVRGVGLNHQPAIVISALPQISTINPWVKFSSGFLALLIAVGDDALLTDMSLAFMETVSSLSVEHGDG